MKLVHEKAANKGFLVRTHCAGGTNTPLLPGDMVRHWQDQNSAGMIIAVSHDAREAPDVEALVLWTRIPFNGNYPPAPTSSIFYLDYQYGSGSLGSDNDETDVIP